MLEGDCRRCQRQRRPFRKRLRDENAARNCAQSKDPVDDVREHRRTSSTSTSTCGWLSPSEDKWHGIKMPVPTVQSVVVVLVDVDTHTDTNTKSICTFCQCVTQSDARMPTLPPPSRIRLPFIPFLATAVLSMLWPGCDCLQRSLCAVRPANHSQIYESARV